MRTLAVTTMKASIASQTRLPPSPELTGLAGNNPMQLRDFSLSGTDAGAANSASACSTTTGSGGRLASVALYESFHPQALATTSFNDSSSAAIFSSCGNSSSNNNSDTSHFPQQKGAVAGPEGVAVFLLDKPHVPVLILPHHAATGRISQLAFSQSHYGNDHHNLYLSSARGSGILVWDVSGHSLSPLQGRLGVSNSSSMDEYSGEGAVTSLTWMGGKLLATTCASAASLWDIRSASLSHQRPVLRFGVRGSATPPPAAYQQIACGQETECAIMDASGVVRIFDTRMGGAGGASSSSSIGSKPVVQWEACKHAGVGVNFMSGKSCWVTWGLDSPSTDAVVKVWRCYDDFKDSPGDYWFMDGSPAAKNKKTPSPPYRMVGRCTTRNLACARVCPAPVEDSIVTIGVSGKEWRADLHKLQFPENAPSKLERIVTFKEETSLKAVTRKHPGSLTAADVAFLPNIGKVPSTEVSAGLGLVLCCLTENGFVTTHSIPEAIPGDPFLSPLKKSSSHDKILPSLLAGHSTKLFPSEWESSVADAARPWAKESVSNGPERVLDWRDAHAGSAAGTGGSGGMTPAAEGGVMPFDMDLPVAYAMAKTGNDLISPSSGSVIGSSDDHSDHEGIDTAALMEKIETDRIPCPRLCGATFSPGVGGLAAFHNGDVKRMWHWWKRNNPARLAAVPGLIGEPSLGDPKSLIGTGTSSIAFNDNNKAVPTTNCPRTLKDLVDMTEAAKQAQWGEHDESEASSTGFPAVGSKFFEEDDSASSSESGEEQQGDEEDEKQQMYDNYFSGYQRPLVVQLLNQDTADQNEKRNSGDGEFISAVGPSSDMLTPLVKVSHECDQLALNNQTSELAIGWQLGIYNVDNLDGGLIRETSQSKLELLKVPSAGSAASKTTVDALASPETPSRRALPSYRSLLPSPPGSRNESKGSYEDERGVHGGEYSVRPNMQESMVFLRKLFTHQHGGQEGGIGSFQNLLSPPDSPMLSKNLRSARNPTKRNFDNNMRLGVYTLRAEKAATADEGLSQIVGICKENAKISRISGQEGKMHSWELIAKIVKNRINHNVGLGFDGWGGPRGGALGAGLVQNVLKYYESLGDVQMLATIVCVLRSKQQHSHDGKNRSWLFLPPNQDARYDAYIRRYAYLLYGWGLLTIRAEVIKHMVRVYEPVGADGIDDDQLTIGLCFKCPQCGGSTEFGTNYCRTCQDYAFRCALCDHAVRGLFTMCDSCGHGGHVNHMKEWFASHDECPSGCGCNCRLASSAALQREADFSVPGGTHKPMMKHQVAYPMS